MLLLGSQSEENQQNLKNYLKESALKMSKKSKENTKWEERPTDYPLTREFIYRNASARIKNEFKKIETSQKSFLSGDPVFCNILNNKRAEKNAFLIPDYAMSFSGKGDYNIKYGLLNEFTFQDKSHVLWGNEEEKEQNLEGFHWNLILDLEKTRTELIEKVLFYYIPYAKLIAYKNVLSGYDDREYVLKYFLFDIKEFDNIPNERKNAINFLLLVPKYKERFKKMIYELYENDSFHCLHNTLKILAEKNYIPMLKECFINNNTLGMRTKMIIEQDFIAMDKLLHLCDENINYVIKNDELKTQLLINKHSFDYIEHISFIQSQYLLEKTL